MSYLNRDGLEALALRECIKQLEAERDALKFQVAAFTAAAPTEEEIDDLAELLNERDQLLEQNSRLREAILFTVRDGHAHKACVEQMLRALK